MTYSPNGRCPDCVAVGDTPDLAAPGRSYCTVHGLDRQRHRKRRNQAVSRARKAGQPDPAPEEYLPRPKASFKAVYLDGNDIWAITLASLPLRDMENRVRAAMEGTDHYAVGLAAEDLVAANREFRTRLFTMLGRTTT
jgi:hypothetical protein